MNPEKINIEPSWKNILLEEFQKDYFSLLTTYVKKQVTEGVTIYPAGPLIFNAFAQTPFDKVKVVILGQDPYHNPGEAMGLCFSVPRLVKIPPSLKNVYAEIERDLNVKMPTHGDLTSWATQGVFLLNAILTVEKNKPASHHHIGWQTFTDAVISIISAQHQHVVFMLWGNYAKSKKPLIDQSRHLVLEAAHPSPLARNAFSGCRHFSKANAYLIQNHKTPINWEQL
jgi:uracil-DNA glycosylase